MNFFNKFLVFLTLLFVSETLSFVVNHEPNPDNVPTANCFPWDNAAFDGATADPDNHKVVIENNYTRVVEVYNPVGFKEPYHTHARPSLFIEDKSAALRHYNGSGIVLSEMEMKPYDVYMLPASYARGTLYPMDPNDLHSVQNIDQFDFHAVRIELKLKPAVLKCSFPNSPGEFVVKPNIEYVPEEDLYNANCPMFKSQKKTTKNTINGNSTATMTYEDQYVRITEITIQPGDKLPLNAVLFPSVAVIDRPAGISVYNDKGQIIAESNPKITPELEYNLPVHYADGNIRWYESQTAHAIENIDNKAFHMIRVEIKGAVPSNKLC